PMALDDEAALIAGWNATAHPLPEEATVVDLIERAAALAADAPAVVARDESLTYAELMRRVRRFRSYLHARGVVPGELVGVCLDRSVDMVVAVLGIMD